MEIEKPNRIEFQRVWMRCVDIMDVIVSTHGYEGLTLENISAQSGFGKDTLLRCFLSLENLLLMYDQLTIVYQSVKVSRGLEPLI